MLINEIKNFIVAWVLTNLIMTQVEVIVLGVRMCVRAEKTQDKDLLKDFSVFLYGRDISKRKWFAKDILVYLIISSTYGMIRGLWLMNKYEEFIYARNAERRKDKAQ